jgi:ABC-type nitrate/sulfonate/bicarbonate transport system substrate-binding protein
MSHGPVRDIRRRLLPRLAPAAAIALALAVAPQRADAEALEVFATPSVGLDMMWVADAKGIFAQEGLQVRFRLFPSGTTAFQTFRAGGGDLIFSGDLPALQYWQNGGSYQVIAPAERDAGGYIAVTTKAITTAKDLVGKTIATRVGSTGSWFVSEYLTKNAIDETALTVRNLDPPLMPVALCQGNIDGFFIWLPSPAKAIQICGDKVHYLTTAEGYIKGYNIGGARKEFLADPHHADSVKRFLRALRKGAEFAAANQADTTADLIKRFGYSAEEVEAFHAIMERVLRFDATFFDDFCSENRWQQRAGLRGGPSDLGQWIWADGLRSLDPQLVVAAPPPC